MLILSMCAILIRKKRCKNTTKLRKPKKFSEFLLLKKPNVYFSLCSGMGCRVPICTFIRVPGAASTVAMLPSRLTKVT